ncbi:hypothetical protein CEXT_153191 [Caerostris extrusa]|uniref:Uncharacterized protein n=1 Tax=Caerostris extrusa TaxID=172846 RepID=A0AAV4R9U2_CAEEX|nr:hypothetical protein CEXT_153191 [Caerostris extrusa]
MGNVPIYPRRNKQPPGLSISLKGTDPRNFNWQRKQADVNDGRNDSCDSHNDGTHNKSSIERRNDETNSFWHQHLVKGELIPRILIGKENTRTLTMGGMILVTRTTTMDSLRQLRSKTSIEQEECLLNGYSPSLNTVVGETFNWFNKARLLRNSVSKASQIF